MGVLMIGSYALVKDSIVSNVIVWAGPEESPMQFDEGVAAIEVKDGAVAAPGYSYINGVFKAPAPTKEEIEQAALAKVSSNIMQKKYLLDEASQRVSILQDAVDLEMATDEEAAALPLWKKYRVLLSRIDANTSEDVNWPKAPSF
jgi:hypothetical protein